MPLTKQPIHHRLILLGPLVLELALFKFLHL